VREILRRGAVPYTLAALLLALGVAFLLRGCAEGGGPDPSDAARARAALNPPATTAVAGGNDSSITPPRTAGPRPGIATTPAPVPTEAARPAEPVRLVAPSVGIAMPVDPTGVARDGQMELPDDIRRIGWYEYGPSPGGPRGAAVLAGHVDSDEQGVGPLARLRDLDVGDRLVVRLDDGTSDPYRVDDVLRIRKGDLDLDAVFDRAGPARVHVLTCGGRFDASTGQYEDNVLVIARPESADG
jgi:hypothetical protein